MSKLILTKIGEEKLKKDLKNLKTKKLYLINEFNRARKMGDLSENSEYITIKNLKIKTENEIKRIENILNSYELFDKEKIKNKDIICFSANIDLENLNKKKIESYKIVSNEEININNKYLSIESPLAKAILGKKINDIIIIKNLNKKIKYKILSIEYN